MPVDPLDIDLQAASFLVPLLQRRPACVAHGTGYHPRHPGSGRRAGGVDGRGRMRGKRHVAYAELRARNLEDDVGNSLTHLGCRAVDRGTAVGVELNSCRGVVVEALRVADVLEADREADPAPDALAARRVARAARKTHRIARELFGLGNVERGCTANDIRDRKRPGDRLTGRQRAAGPERVQQTQLDRIDVERLRELVHLSLVSEANLYRAEAAHGTARWVVRIDTRALDQSVVDRVRPDRERGRIGRDGSRAGGIRAAVEQYAHTDVDEPSVARRAVLGPDLRGMPVDVADEGLLAVVDDLDRTVRVQREQRAVDLHRQVLAAAERTSHAREVDAHLLGLQIQARRDLIAIDVQPLGCDVHVDAALAVRHGEPRLGPEEGLVLDPDLVDTGDRDVTLGRRIPLPDHERADDVRTWIVPVAVAHGRPVGMERLSLCRALRVDKRLERLVLDANPLCSASSLLRMLRGDERNRLPEIAHALVGEHGLILKLEPITFLAGDVLVRQHRVDAGHADRR